MKKCPNCDEKLDDEMIADGVCDHCGTPFKEWELSGEGDPDEKEAEEAEEKDEKEEEKEAEEEEKEEKDPDDEEDDDVPRGRKRKS